MKQAGIRMSVMMGAVMSFSLSLLGLLSAGQFTLKGFLINFLLSFAISLLLGLLIPVRKITLNVLKKSGLKPGSVQARCLEALISDLLYSPLMTLVMVSIAYRQAVSHGAKIPFGPMLAKAELLSFAAAFVLIYFLSPVLMKIAFKDVQE